MDPQIEEIKSKIDPIALIGQHVKLSRAGRNFKGLCPFHAERTPSFMVSPDRGTWRCFGCGENGDIIAFLEKYDHLTFQEALEQLAKQAGVTFTKTQRDDPARLARQRQLDALNLAADYYHYILTQHSLGKEARGYLQQRQISQETIIKFKLGYAPNSWRSLSQFLTQKGYKESELAQAGLLAHNQSGHTYDRFRGRLLFPVADTQGRTVGFSGRSLTDDPNTPKYLNSADNDLFHKGQLLFGLQQAKEAIRRNNRIILVEGNVDVLTSNQAGVEEVVAPLGTALTADQVRIAKRFTANIFLAFDNDKAGQTATRRSLELLRQEDIDAKVISISQAKDPDELIKQDPDLWRQAINQAKDIFEFYLQYVSSTFDTQTERGKRQAAQEIIPIIKATTDHIAQSFIIQKTAAALGVDEPTLRQELSDPQPKSTPASVSNPSSGQGTSLSPSRPLAPRTLSRPSRQSILARHLLSQLLNLPPDEADGAQIRPLLQSLPSASFTQDLQPIVAAILQACQDHQPLDLARVAASLEGAALNLFDQLSLTDPDTIGDRVADPWLNLRHIARQLHQLALRSQLTDLSRAIKQAEALDQDANTLKQDFARITTQLSGLESK